MATAPFPLADLPARVRRALAGRASEFDLDPDGLEVEPILNRGGFVNRSFAVSDGRTRLHLKLGDREHQPRLERWRALANRLAAAYHAPALRGWMELPARDWAGPLTEWIEGQTPRSLERGMQPGLVTAVGRLHGDQDLAADLIRLGDRPGTCATRYLGSYHDRFTEDLKGIRAAPPPFLSTADLQWMAEEADGLAEAVHAAPAFQAPADAPVHGDLWLDNILQRPDGAWFVLDWDELGLGDPAMDWAMLFGPSPHDLTTVTERAAVQSLDLTAHERARLELYARASLLDWVIDPLADWVEAEHEAERDAVRRRNESVHREARRRYEARYG